MNDPEVVRLRRLRLTALRVRALARAFTMSRDKSSDPSFLRIACASWRVARSATGRLRAHPYERYQRDPSGLILAAYGALAWAAALAGMSRMTALRLCTGQLRLLARQLGDARALTWLPDLSDTFGRSQSELGALIHALAYETRSAGDVERALPLAAVGDRRRAARQAPPALEGEWPYLAF